MSISNAKKQRNVSIEVLRILSMLLIIFLHSIDHSGVLEAADYASSGMYLYVQFTYMLMQVCVNIYVLISGYFLVTSKFKLQKLFVLWLEVIFYSLIIRLAFIAVGYSTFSIGSILSCFIPVFTGRYWFITIYFGLYLVFPFLNKFIKAMNKKQHTALNILLFVLFSVWISIYPSFAGMNSGGGWGLPWFVVLYFMASWFRLYYVPNKKALGKVLIWLLLSAIIAAVMLVGKTRLPILQTFASQMHRYDSVPALISSLCLFAAFLNIDIKNNIFGKIILFISPSTLGVYLIHAHADFSPWSWEFLNLPAYMDSYMFILIQIGVVLGIFVLCTLIDILRRYTVGRIENSRMVTAVCDGITGFVSKKILSRIKCGNEKNECISN